MSSWDHFGEVANVIQLAGLNAGALIGLIVRAANTARMHKKNCRQFAQHIKLIGNLLEQLKITELKKYPETSEPLEQLEDALRRAYLLVNSCQERSYLYLMAMGWNIVYQFRRAQEEIDRYLRIIPLIALIDNARIKERLEEIERDQREYTLDEDDRKVQVALSQNDMMILKKSLSCSYGNVPIDKALRKERQKLEVELQYSQANMDVGQCQVIERLMEVTENAVNSVEEHDSPHKVSSTEHFSGEKNTIKVDTSKGTSVGKPKAPQVIIRRQPRKRSLGKTNGMRIYLAVVLNLTCVKTFVCPCDTLSKIASVATGNEISPAQTCNDIMAYSLILSCCCYTCCVRRKLRRTLNIKVKPQGCFSQLPLDNTVILLPSQRIPMQFV
ncbi:hypothetical protein OROGR_021481 [Orobanche gracilis]